MSLSNKPWMTGFKAISADVESERVLKLHFDHKVADEDRRKLVDAINGATKLRAALLSSPCPLPICGAKTVEDCIKAGNCTCDNAEALKG